MAHSSRSLEFTIKEEHIKLLDRMYISWDDCEFGAPAVDCKRPYGNSDVYNDIAEILGIKLEEGKDEFTNDQVDSMGELHDEMQEVLQILVRHAVTGIRAGDVFVRETNWDSEWKRK